MFNIHFYYFFPLKIYHKKENDVINFIFIQTQMNEKFYNLRYQPLLTNNFFNLIAIILIIITYLNHLPLHKCLNHHPMVSILNVLCIQAMYQNSTNNLI